MTKEEIRKRINSLERQYHSLAKYLPYADGQAYYKDRQRMQEIQAEIGLLTKRMWEITNANSSTSN